MKNIVVLIDFTRVCEPAVVLAGLIARKAEAKLILLHVAAEDQRANFDKLMEELDVFAAILGKRQLNLVRHVEFGDFMTIIGNTLQMLIADLIVVGTHGIRGRQRNLFSKNIASLLKELNMPSIIVQGQQELEPSDLTSWLISGDRAEEELAPIAWLQALYTPEIRTTASTADAESIETEAFDHECSLIVWHGDLEKGMDLILNHFGIPVLLI